MTRSRAVPLDRWDAGGRQSARPGRQLWRLRGGLGALLTQRCSASRLPRPGRWTPSSASCCRCACTWAAAGSHGIAVLPNAGLCSREGPGLRRPSVAYLVRGVPPGSCQSLIPGRLQETWGMLPHDAGSQQTVVAVGHCQAERACRRGGHPRDWQLWRHRQGRQRGCRAPVLRLRPEGMPSQPSTPAHCMLCHSSS